METCVGSVGLRQIYLADLPLVLAWRSNREVTRYLPCAPDTPTWEQQLAWYEEPGQDLRALITLSTHVGVPTKFWRPVGTTHFNAETGEVGLVVGEKTLWGCGIGKAALGLTLGKVLYSSYRVQDDRGVWAVVHPDNWRSRRLFESFGFVHEGEGRAGQMHYRWAPPEPPGEEGTIASQA